MMAIYPEPDEKKAKLIDSICLFILYLIAFLVILFTAPGCKSDDQKYRPFYEPPAAKTPVSKIKPAVHDAATRVDDVLEKTPVPAVAEVLVDDVLDTIEQINPLPKSTAPDPKVAAIIEPEPDPLFAAPDNIDEPIAATDESGIGLTTWLVAIGGIAAFGFICFKALKGNEDVKDSDSQESTI